MGILIVLYSLAKFYYCHHTFGFSLFGLFFKKSANIPEIQLLKQAYSTITKNKTILKCHFT